MNAPDSYVIRTADNKELTFYTNPQTRYFINGNQARYGDYKVGSEVTGFYRTDKDRNYLNAFYVGQVPQQANPAPVAPGAADGTAVQGTIIRVVGKDQVVIKTEGDKEITVYVNPETKYLYNEKPAQYSEFQGVTVGTPIQVYYDNDTKLNRPVARRILWRRK